MLVGIEIRASGKKHQPSWSSSTSKTIVTSTQIKCIYIVTASLFRSVFRSFKRNTSSTYSWVDNKPHCPAFGQLSIYVYMYISKAIGLCNLSIWLCFFDPIETNTIIPAVPGLFGTATQHHPSYHPYTQTYRIIHNTYTWCILFLLLYREYLGYILSIAIW